jgi:hypothetical protein
LAGGCWLGVQRSQQGGEQVLDLAGAGVEPRGGFGRQLLEVARKERVVRGLAHRTRGAAHAARKLPFCVPTGAFGELGRHRGGGPAKLSREPEGLLGWEALRVAVDAERESMRLLPGVEPLEIPPVVLRLIADS